MFDGKAELVSYCEPVITIIIILIIIRLRMGGAYVVPAHVD